LNDAGFTWTLHEKNDERFNDLMSFKAKYSYCYVCQSGENVSLGRWCSEIRSSYKKIQNNQEPKVKLSDEQIQRLNDAGFQVVSKCSAKESKLFSGLLGCSH
jgi:hypothetical protein